MAFFFFFCLTVPSLSHGSVLLKYGHSFASNYYKSLKAFRFNQMKNRLHVEVFMQHAVGFSELLQETHLLLELIIKLEEIVNLDTS